MQQFTKYPHHKVGLVTDRDLLIISHDLHPQMELAQLLWNLGFQMHLCITHILKKWKNGNLWIM